MLVKKLTFLSNVETSLVFLVIGGASRIEEFTKNFLITGWVRVRILVPKKFFTQKV